MYVSAGLHEMDIGFHTYGGVPAAKQRAITAKTHIDHARETPGQKLHSGREPPFRLCTTRWK